MVMQPFAFWSYQSVASMFAVADSMSHAEHSS